VCCFLFGFVVIIVWCGFRCRLVCFCFVLFLFPLLTLGCVSFYLLTVGFVLSDTLCLLYLCLFLFRFVTGCLVYAGWFFLR